MKTDFGLGSVALATAATIAIVQPAYAQTQVTGVQVNTTGVGIEVILNTDGDETPQTFLVRSRDALVATVINTQLRLPQGNAYIQENPYPGISSVTVRQLDPNSIRVVVRGTGSPPLGRILSDDDRGIALAYSPTSEDSAAPPPSSPSAARPDVLVPEPNISIDGLPASPGRPNINPAPPQLPRAVPPPVGDIAISNVAPYGRLVSLDTAERIPRLVLRDAPVRDVLALLARAAGYNLAYSGSGGEEDGDEEGMQLTISLDVENESVEDVFNNILQLSGLEANVRGRSIVVGPNLPDTARDVISRTLRLNQASLLQARNFLVANGAETIEVNTREQRRTFSIDENLPPEVITTLQTEVELLTASEGGEYEGDAALPLRGLLVTIDTRTNAITLVGEPRTVEVASTWLTQLDVRRRQVAVNVKILDINLLNTEDFNTSFSFGIDDTFVVVDNGSAIVNFGTVQPPSGPTTNNSLISPPVIDSPFRDAEPFVVPPSAPLGPNGNPLQPGITDFDPGETDVQVVDGQVITTRTSDTITFGLPSLFQFPDRFLANLQAQIVNGNAKILTDPTLVIQEGSTATVNLTNQVVQQVEIEFTDTDAGTRESRNVVFTDVGLTLTVNVDRIDDNGFVTLSVLPRVSAPTGQVELGDGQFATTVQERALQSGDIRLRDGQTLILSGIIQDSDRTTVSKVPILGDLPLIGSLFRSTNRQNQRQEVIVLLTPNVLLDDELSTFGYGYTPGPEAREMLQQQQNYYYGQ